jgi:hypothetical protein
MRTFFLAGLAVAAALLAPGGQAQAVTVTCSVTGSTVLSCAPSSATVGIGPEFIIKTADQEILDADFSTGVRHRAHYKRPFRGFLDSTALNFADLTSPFTAAQLISIVGWTEVDSSDLSISNGTFSLNLAGASFFDNGFLSIQLSQPSAIAPVPVPRCPAPLRQRPWFCGLVRLAAKGERLCTGAKPRVVGWLVGSAYAKPTLP